MDSKILGVKDLMNQLLNYIAENKIIKHTCHSFSSPRYKARMKRPRNIRASDEGPTKEDWRVQCEKRVNVSISEISSCSVRRKWDVNVDLCMAGYLYVLFLDKWSL